jgi:hypothetical protein
LERRNQRLPDERQIDRDEDFSFHFSSVWIGRRLSSNPLESTLDRAENQRAIGWDIGIAEYG